jgi:hypothetical protein
LIEIIAFPISTPAYQQKADDDFYELYGAWESDRSAEEMITELKSAREFREKDLIF